MAVGLTLVKEFPYRGNSEEEWSNTYRLTGIDPPGTTEWLALANALAAEEVKLYTSRVKIIRFYGYNSDADNAAAVYVRDLKAAAQSMPGTLVTTTALNQPGDTAGWIRWKTSRLTSRGKAIYLRKYYHDVYIETGNWDNMDNGQHVAYLAFGTKMWDGSFLDARKIRARGQSTETILGSNASTYLTTRTLKRRGKRPPTTP